MFRKGRFVSAIAFVLLTLMPGFLCADSLTVPFGTRVFLELDQKVTSKKKHNKPGSFVQAHVWRDVVVDGRTVVKAGTPAMVQVGNIKGAKVAGVKGKVELKALEVVASDGTSLMLSGGYDQSGKSRTALSVSLAVVVFLPLIFIKGKQAKLQPGTVFDAMVANPTLVEVDEEKRRKIKIAHSGPLAVEVSYDKLDEASNQNKGIKSLPLRISFEGDFVPGATITRVNEKQIQPISIAVGGATLNEDGYAVADGSVNLKQLAKHLNQGFNQFTVDVGGETDEVMLDLEL